MCYDVRWNGCNEIISKNKLLLHLKINVMPSYEMSFRVHELFVIKIIDFFALRQEHRGGFSLDQPDFL